MSLNFGVLSIQGDVIENIISVKAAIDALGIDGTVTSVEVPRHRAVDIDDMYDFNFAESILNNTFNEGDQC